MKKSITILKSRDWGEYRVPSPDGREAGAYYTNDRTDAIATAHAMFNRYGHVIEVKFKTVDDWPAEKKNPPRGGKAKRAKSLGRKRIYGRILAIEAVKGTDSLWPMEKFRHDFTAKDAEIHGNPDGSITIRSRSGKKLWRQFDYTEEDVRRS